MSALSKERAKRIDIAFAQLARAVKLYRGDDPLPQPFIAMVFGKFIGMAPEMRQVLNGGGDEAEASVRRLRKASFTEVDAMYDR